VLVDGKTNRGHAVPERVPFELLQMGAVRARERLLLPDVHLPMKNVHTLDADGGGLVNDRLNRHTLGAEVPVRITGDGEFDPWLWQFRRARNGEGWERNGARYQRGSGESG